MSTPKKSSADAHPIKAVAYIRVSTGKQVSEGYGLDDQRHRITAFCAAKGWPLERIYVDAGVSAVKRRPEWEQLLVDVLADGITHVVSTKLTRVGRSTRDLLDTYEMLESKGVALVLIDESIDTSTPAGRLMRTILAAVAEFERELLVERTVSGMAEAKRQGVKLGRKADVPDDLADRIVAARLAGRSYQSIADTLNAEQVATPRGSAFWRPSTVHAVVARVAPDVAAQTGRPPRPI